VVNFNAVESAMLGPAMLGPAMLGPFLVKPFFKRFFLKGLEYISNNICRRYCK